MSMVGCQTNNPEWHVWLLKRRAPTANSEWQQGSVRLSIGDRSGIGLTLIPNGTLDFDSSKRSDHGIEH